MLALRAPLPGLALTGRAERTMARSRWSLPFEADGSQLPTAGQIRPIRAGLFLVDYVGFLIILRFYKLILASIR